MKKRSFTKQFVLPLFVLVPILVYGLFELNSLTADEKALEQVYERQLDAVLFSIDQYTDDRLRKWATELEDNAELLTSEEGLLRISDNNQAFRALYVQDPWLDEAVLLSNSDLYKSPEFRSLADKIYNSSDKLFGQLKRYKKSDFQKLEVLKGTYHVGSFETVALPIVVGQGEGMKSLLFFFDVEDFISHVLGPKFEEISRSQFVLVCRKTNSDSLVFATAEDYSDALVTQSLGPLPEYEVGIAQTGGTVQEAVAQRKRQNLISLGLLIIFLLFGLGLVFRNIRRELELAQNKADFVSNVSHEIRTPLALINMFAETLQMGRVRTEEKKQEYYAIITKEVSRLTNMVNRILSFSKMEANKREYNLQPLCLNEVAQEVMNTYSYHLESNGFEYDFKTADSVSTILADKEALIEMLVNLIDNAMKYSLEYKKVEVLTGMESDKVFVSVKDSGMGIPKGQLDKLFEKFYRVPKGDVHETKGAGLGLTIVKQIMDAHQGQVNVESTLGKGSTFTLLFPVTENKNGENTDR